jgi:hypothetical protein
MEDESDITGAVPGGRSRQRSPQIGQDMDPGGANRRFGGSAAESSPRGASPRRVERVTTGCPRQQHAPQYALRPSWRIRIVDLRPTVRYVVGALGRIRVSYIRTATTMPLPAVSAATTQTAARMPYASARTPASKAPTANPPSRHSR